MPILSYENEISFTCKLNSFSYEWLCTRPRFEREALGNAEMVYYLRCHVLRDVTNKILCSAWNHVIASRRITKGWVNTWLSDQMRIPRVVMISETVELPLLCYVFLLSNICAHHFAMSIFRYLQQAYRIYYSETHRFSQFSSIILSNSRLTFNQGINHSKIHSAHQFWDFQYLLVWQSIMVKLVSSEMRYCNKLLYIFNNYFMSARWI